jgi:hypothetical protein
MKFMRATEDGNSAKGTLGERNEVEGPVFVEYYYLSVIGDILGDFSPCFCVLRS